MSMMAETWKYISMSRSWIDGLRTPGRCAERCAEQVRKIHEVKLECTANETTQIQPSGSICTNFARSAKARKCAESDATRRKDKQGFSYYYSLKGQDLRLFLSL